MNASSQQKQPTRLSNAWYLPLLAPYRAQRGTRGRGSFHSYLSLVLRTLDTFSPFTPKKQALKLLPSFRPSSNLWVLSEFEVKSRRYDLLFIYSLVFRLFSWGFDICPLVPVLQQPPPGLHRRYTCHLCGWDGRNVPCCGKGICMACARALQVGWSWAILEFPLSGAIRWNPESSAALMLVEASLYFVLSSCLSPRSE